MKKKFIVVLAIVVMVCTLSLALVACNPKNPEAFQVVNNSSALNELWDAWAKENFSKSHDTIGLDVNLNYDDSDTDISIALKGGITQAKDNKNALSFVVKDNKKQGTNKDIINLTFNSDALFIYIDGVADKSLKVSDIKFPNLSGGIFDMITIGNISDSLKTILVSLMAYTLDMEDSKITIDPVLNGKDLYDAKYSISFKVNSLIDSVVESYLESFMSDYMQLALKTVKEKLVGVKVEITANTTGNTRKKVEKPAKGAPKYEYVGGTLVDSDIAVGTYDSKLTINTKASDIKILNSIPEIKAPTDFIEFDNYLLPSNVNGAFNLKDKNGNILSKYDYTANFDFNMTEVASTILDCFDKKSMVPLINAMLSDQNGKIFVEINHTCDDSCLLDHLSKTSKPVLTIAYSPVDFGNNRIYIAVNLRGILSSDFGEQMLENLPDGSTATAQDIIDLLPEEDLIFTIDLQTYSTISSIKNAADNSRQAIVNLLDSVATTTYEQNKNIDITSILNAVMSIEELAVYKYSVEKAMDIIMKDVDSIDIAYTHTNEHYTDGNIKEQFMQNKTFVYGDGTVIAPIIDKLTFAEKSEGVVQINGQDGLYNEDGTFNALTEKQVFKLIGSTITATYTDMLGNTISEELVVFDILGFDSTKVEQTVYLVVSGNLGNNYNQFVKNVKDMFEENDSQTEVSRENVAEAVVKISFKLQTA